MLWFFYLETPNWTNSNKFLINWDPIQQQYTVHHNLEQKTSRKKENFFAGYEISQFDRQHKIKKLWSRLEETKEHSNPIESYDSKKRLKKQTRTLQIGQMTLRATALASSCEPLGFWFFSAFRFWASIFCFPRVIFFVQDFEKEKQTIRFGKFWSQKMANFILSEINIELKTRLTRNEKTKLSLHVLSSSVRFSVT